MRFALAAATVLGLASLAVAVDDRQLVKFKSKSSVFCKKWNAACKDFKPKDTSLVFANSYCILGDFHGKHTSDEAKVYCSFVEKKDPKGPRKTVTKSVAKAVGAKYVTA